MKVILNLTADEAMALLRAVQERYDKARPFEHLGDKSESGIEAAAVASLYDKIMLFLCK